MHELVCIVRKQIMNDLLFSLIFSFSFLVTSLLVVSMFYWPLYIQWIAFTKNCHEIFGNQPNFDKICFAIKEKNENIELEFIFAEF